MKFVKHGEWEQEPDREEFAWAELPCSILRHKMFGHLCGYVGVMEGHPAYGMSSDNLDISVHGGLTWGQEGDGEYRPEGFWWFGFDCNHYTDFAPGMPSFVGGDRCTYRNWVWVKEEVQRLADQLADMVIMPSLEEWLAKQGVKR